jgi:hypothetical protein
MNGPNGIAVQFEPQGNGSDSDDDEDEYFDVPINWLEILNQNERIYDYDEIDFANLDE